MKLVLQIVLVFVLALIVCALAESSVRIEALRNQVRALGAQPVASLSTATAATGDTRRFTLPSSIARRGFPFAGVSPAHNPPASVDETNRVQSYRESDAVRHGTQAAGRRRISCRFYEPTTKTAASASSVTARDAQTKPVMAVSAGHEGSARG